MTTEPPLTHITPHTHVNKSTPKPPEARKSERTARHLTPHPYFTAPLAVPPGAGTGKNITPHPPSQVNLENEQTATRTEHALRIYSLHHLPGVVPERVHEYPAEQMSPVELVARVLARD